MLIEKDGKVKNIKPENVPPYLAKGFVIVDDKHVAAVEEVAPEPAPVVVAEPVAPVKQAKRKKGSK